MNDQIKNLLDQGYSVYSGAMGRLGEIVKVDGEDVFIKSVKGFRAVTTLNRGDKVEIIKMEDSKYDYLVCNSVEVQQ